MAQAAGVVWVVKREAQVDHFRCWSGSCSPTRPGSGSHRSHRRERAMQAAAVVATPSPTRAAHRLEHDDVLLGVAAMPSRLVVDAPAGTAGSSCGEWRAGYPAGGLRRPRSTPVPPGRSGTQRCPFRVLPIPIGAADSRAPVGPTDPRISYPNRSAVPGLRQEQPPASPAEAQSVAACTLSRIRQFPVLPSAPQYIRATLGELAPSLGEAGVVDDEGLRADELGRPPRQPPPHLRVVPGRGEGCRRARAPRARGPAAAVLRRHHRGP
jgi:hypothetical protein